METTAEVERSDWTQNNEFSFCVYFFHQDLLTWANNKHTSKHANNQTAVDKRGEETRKGKKDRDANKDAGKREILRESTKHKTISDTLAYQYQHQQTNEEKGKTTGPFLTIEHRVQYNLVGPVSFLFLQSISVTQRSCKLMVLINKIRLVPSSSFFSNDPYVLAHPPRLCNRAFSHSLPFTCLLFSLLVLARLVPFFSSIRFSLDFNQQQHQQREEHWDLIAYLKTIAKPTFGFRRFLSFRSLFCSTPLSSCIPHTTNSYALVVLELAHKSSCHIYALKAKKWSFILHSITASSRSIGAQKQQGSSTGGKTNKTSFYLVATFSSPIIHHSSCVKIIKRVVLRSISPFLVPGCLRLLYTQEPIDFFGRKPS